MFMLPDQANIQYLVGHSGVSLRVAPLQPYHEKVCAFLNELSRALLGDAEAKQFPDLIAFGYWCRRANIEKLKHQFAEERLRLGLGVVFHVAPSNVPINFAFSFAFALLAGNASIVRVPSKQFPQIEIFRRVMCSLLQKEAYKSLAEENIFVRYPHDDEITKGFSAMCHARVIWGGDTTIQHIRRIPIAERGVEVAFADRYSFAVMGSNEMLQLEDPLLHRVASGFYNDAYVMDQNACSSPHLIVWLGSQDAKGAQERFWESVHHVAKSKYELQPIHAVDKYWQLCSRAVEMHGKGRCRRHGNYIYRIELDQLSTQLETYRGQFGLFYEYVTEDINELAPLMSSRYQTITYAGVEKGLLRDFVIKNSLLGIDRIVPVGSALDMSVVWDGYDIIRSLSRIVDCQ